MAEPTPFYMQKGFIASGVFLLVLALAGVAMALTGGGGHSDGPSLRARGLSGKVETGGSVCGLPAGRQDPVVGPPITKWDIVGFIAAPTVPRVGPGILAGKDRRCFAHSPVGALVAAANLAAMVSLPDNAISFDEGLRHIVPSRTRDIYSKQPTAPVDPTMRLQIAGFRVDVVGRDDVNVTLALRTNINAGAMVSWTAPMHWMAPGDWRMRLGSVEEPFIGGALASLDGYVPWSGA